MDNDSRFMDLVKKVPVENDTLIGQAMSWFIKKQEPGEVQFTEYNNGYQIKVFTDDKNKEEARKFWEKNVQPRLGDGK